MPIQNPKYPPGRVYYGRPIPITIVRYTGEVTARETLSVQMISQDPETKPKSIELVFIRFGGNLEKVRGTFL